MSASQGTPGLLHNSALRARLSEIDVEIVVLDAQLARLRAEAKIVTDALSFIVYPILTLPVEITSEIFMQYLDGLFEGQFGPPRVELRTARTSGPLVLSQVCRAWRSIAINTPLLWCRVFADSFYDNCPDWRRLLECWLPRAGNHPLYLGLADDHHFTALHFPTIAPYSSQWRAFECCISTPVTFPIDTIRGRLPLLRELTITWREWDSVDTEFSTVDAFSVAPELRKVVLRNLPPKWIPLPLAQLTHITLYGQTIADAIEVLHQCPNLEELSIELDGAEDEVPLAPVIHTRIHKLSLWNECSATPEILPYITLPNLHSLELRGFTRLSPTIAVCSWCAVDSISLHYCYIDLVDFALGAVWQVSQVTFDRISCTPSRLGEILGRMTSDSRFLPNMTSLHLLDCGTVVPYVEVADMLDARRHNPEGVSRLESFHFIQGRRYIDEEPNAAIEGKLRGLMDEGLDIRIQGRDRRFEYSGVIRGVNSRLRPLLQ
ncbi:F-box domain-containing protein [Favolaschia claudopus]|uniref:F-box domain-containing protein n=1 Tax=Favolaschia claudopus TaxID=2862362 RepID=A0AAW0BKG4_9AGAR